MGNISKYTIIAVNTAATFSTLQVLKGNGSQMQLDCIQITIVLRGVASMLLIELGAEVLPTVVIYRVPQLSIARV